ncbi:MFS transporter [Streptococcus sp. DD12]|uniref:MFS transporter n=1 Tax=Streptococcus sp. DD12 TaxID=1777880 RepID=UPI0007982638|nr:MFS transporter [Streptococcus sp. DD12]KXT76390.1 Cyanate permease [Streptococcus sp. DD12]
MKKSACLIPGIILLGAVMRVPFTAIPTILTDIASGLHVSISNLGILTSLPLLMFALFSSLAPAWAAKIGLEKLLALSLFVLLLGSLVRIISLPALYLGTLLVGFAIAMINVLLPSLVSHYFPQKVGFYTALYLTVMGLTTALGSSLAVPIVNASSWQIFILLLSGLIGLATLVWLPNTRHNHRFAQAQTNGVATSLWRNKAALVFLVFGGLQSLLYYTLMAWLPTIAQTAGLSQVEAGLIAGAFSFISIPVSMVTPSLIARLNQKGRIAFMTAVAGLSVLGLVGLLLPSAKFNFWLVISLLLGLSTSVLFPYMMLSFSLKTSNSQATARLSGMVQSGGYCIAATGPALLGYSFSAFHSWAVLVIVLLLATLLMTLAIFAIEKHDTIL